MPDTVPTQPAAPNLANELEIGAQQAERIALRTSPPAPPGPPAATPKPTVPEFSQAKLEEIRKFAAMQGELIDVRKPTARPIEQKPVPPSPTRMAAMNVEAPTPAPAPAPANPAPTVAAPAPTNELDYPGYPNRLLVPESLLMAAIGAAWMMYGVNYLPPAMQTWEMFAAVPGALALFQSIRWLYRGATCGYQLTAKNLQCFAMKPFRNPAPIDLATIVDVQVQQTQWQRLLVAGTLKLKFERDIQAPIELGPVSWPARRARVLQNAIEGARGGQVISGRGVV